MFVAGFTHSWALPGPLWGPSRKHTMNHPSYPFSAQYFLLVRYCSKAVSKAMDGSVEMYTHLAVWYFGTWWMWLLPLHLWGVFVHIWMRVPYQDTWRAFSSAWMMGSAISPWILDLDRPLFAAHDLVTEMYANTRQHRPWALLKRVLRVTQKAQSVCWM